MNKHDFNSDFDTAFQTKKMTEFEDWFCQMAELVWGLDFERVKSGGKYGDKKSDGRLISAERVFQSYAPESIATFAKNAPNKVADSFPDVTTYWRDLREWVFVHNNAGGITTSLSDKLEELRNAFPKITIFEGSRSFIKSELHDKLSVQQLIDVYPASPALKFQNIEMEHIRPLLRTILQHADAEPNPFSFGQEPNQEKLDVNLLSAAAKSDLRMALTKAGLVQRYLDNSNSPQANEILQAEMMTKYQELRGLDYKPDEIMARILKWVGDDGAPDVRHAACVIVAYYFDACDIFENAPEEYA